MNRLTIFTLLLTLLAAPVFANQTTDRPKEAAYRLYVRIIPPGARQVQTIAFCSSGFYETPAGEKSSRAEELADKYLEDDTNAIKKTYGVTAGHCTALYEVVRTMLEKRVYGLRMELTISPQNSVDEFVPVTVEDYGLRAVANKMLGEREDPLPDPSILNDWAVLSTYEDVHTVQLADTNSLSIGDPIHINGFPFALGHFWSQGHATPGYKLPGTIYNDYLATDYVTAQGSSGSIVTDDKGRLVGIHVAGFPGGPGLATPIRKVDFPHNSSYSAGSGAYYSKYTSTHGFEKELEARWDRVKKVLTNDGMIQLAGEKFLRQFRAKVAEVVERLKQ